MPNTSTTSGAAAVIAAICAGSLQPPGGSTVDGTLTWSCEPKKSASEASRASKCRAITASSPASVAYRIGSNDFSSCHTCTTSSRECRMGRAEIGQDLYTPATSKNNPVPAPGSRPNAGWLYVSQTARSLRASRSDELTLTFGVTGRPSLGKFTQTIAHNAAPTFNRPSDWSDQVGFEPGLAARYEQRRRIGQDDRAIGFDVIPRFALTAGNVSTAAEIGLQTRTGWHLRHPWLPRDGPLEIALTGGVSARAVARDLFLDGNTFRDGPHVGHEVFVGSGEIAVLIRFRALSLAYRAVNDTRSYAAGPKWHPWASIVGGVTFGR